MANVTLPQLTRDQAIDAWKALHDTLQSDPVISHLMTSGIHEGLQAQRLLTQRFARAGAKLLNTGGGVTFALIPIATHAVVGIGRAATQFCWNGESTNPEETFLEPDEDGMCRRLGSTMRRG